jgi:hypothetical protein
MPNTERNFLRLSKNLSFKIFLDFLVASQFFIHHPLNHWITQILHSCIHHLSLKCQTEMAMVFLWPFFRFSHFSSPIPTDRWPKSPRPPSQAHSHVSQALTWLVMIFLRWLFMRWKRRWSAGERSAKPGEWQMAKADSSAAQGSSGLSREFAEEAKANQIWLMIGREIWLMIGREIWLIANNSTNHSGNFWF